MWPPLRPACMHIHMSSNPLKGFLLLQQTCAFTVWTHMSTSSSFFYSLSDPPLDHNGDLIGGLYLGPGPETQLD